MIAPTIRSTFRLRGKGWWDFGSGGLGDMGAHIIDHPGMGPRAGSPRRGPGHSTIDGTMLEGGRRNFRDLSNRLDHHL